jgi:hypothetical protein
MQKECLDLIMEGKIITPPKLHLLVLLALRCKMSRSSFGWKNNQWQKPYPVHEIGGINGGKMFRIPK